jgi:D-alanine-D-alanine ligase-like ATP-grasp enzyme
VSLFGIDIIINNQTGQHAIIDVNAFPGEQQGRAPLCWWPPGIVAACLWAGVFS